jgi:hypothetical protein
LMSVGLSSVAMPINNFLLISISAPDYVRDFL